MVQPPRRARPGEVEPGELLDADAPHAELLLLQKVVDPAVRRFVHAHLGRAHGEFGFERDAVDLRSSQQVVPLVAFRVDVRDVELHLVRDLEPPDHVEHRLHVLVVRPPMFEPRDRILVVARLHDERVLVRAAECRQGQQHSCELLDRDDHVPQALRRTAAEQDRLANRRLQRRRPHEHAHTPRREIGDADSARRRVAAEIDPARALSRHAQSLAGRECACERREVVRLYERLVAEQNAQVLEGSPEPCPCPQLLLGVATWYNSEALRVSRRHHVGDGLVVLAERRVDLAEVADHAVQRLQLLHRHVTTPPVELGLPQLLLRAPNSFL